MSLQQFIQAIFDGLSLGMIYVLVASGITLMFGIMHIVNFSHGAILMLGAFACLVFHNFLGINYSLSILMGAILIGMLGIIVGKVCFEAFRGELDRSFITSLGLILIFESSILVIFGGFGYGIESPFRGGVRFLGVSIAWERIVVIGVGLVFMTGLTVFIKLHKLGQAMVASAQDDVAAVLQGIDLAKVSALCMFIGCALAAVGGALVGTLFNVDYAMGGTYTVKCFMVVALGGLGSLPGAVLGGLILGFLETFASIFTGAAIGPLIAFIIVVFFLLFRPRGLLGHEME